MPRRPSKTATPAPSPADIAETAGVSRAKLRVEELRSQIAYHEHRYFVLDAPEVSDADFDALVVELRQLEERHPELITPDSPTQRVGGAPVETFGIVEHRIPMLSLANAFSAEQLRAWHARASRLIERDDFALVCEPKIDGFAVSLVYVECKLSVAATRGDGQRGENITANVQTIEAIPKEIPQQIKGKYTGTPSSFEVRGEVYMTKSGFERVNLERAQRGEPLFASPRNSAAGSVRQKDPTVTASRPLSAFVYQYGGAWPGPNTKGRPGTGHGAFPRQTQRDMLGWLKERGFPVNPHIQRFTSLDGVIAFCESWVDRRDSLDYEIDGIVIKVDDLGLQRQMGAVGREPRWAIAYKFPPTQATTLLRQIAVNVGRTGTLNPFAVLEPVVIGGATVKLATLHNEDDIRRKDIRVGDTVIVQRAGDVIPQVVGPVVSRRPPGARRWSMPKKCPACKTPVMRNEGEAAYFCPNRDCPMQRVRLLEHFVSRGAMDIEGIGEQLAHLLMARGFVRDGADVYTLRGRRDDLIAIERFGAKSVDNLLANIDASKKRPLSRVLVALGIRHVGSEMAAMLAQHFGSIDALISASADEIEAIPGVGRVIAESVVDFFARPDNRDLVQRLRAAGVNLAEERGAAREGPLSGLTFVVTGRLDRLSRNEAESLLKREGATVATTVTKKTTYVVVGADPGTKLAKAEKLAVQTLDEDAFLTLLKARGIAI
jgi:DNA ligase (NAD+)